MRDADRSLTDEWLTSEIQRLCRKLELDSFLTIENREILKTTLEGLIEKRLTLREMTKKKEPEDAGESD